MIKTSQGDILEAEAEALVNTVNCVGVMGRGIALQFKKKFPDNFKAYKKACDAKLLRPGMMLFHDMGQLYNPRYIVNFPTKDHWRAKSRIKDIEDGLAALVKEIKERNIKSIALPPLGCGLGGLNWTDVKSRIVEAVAELEGVEVILYEPAGAPVASKMVKEEKIPNMTVGRAAMIGLMRQYLAAVMDPTITLLEIHKLMYFFKAFGEPLAKLQFTKGPYGPYSENLRHVLGKTEGHFTLGYGDGEDAPEKPIELLEGATLKAEEFLAQHPQTQSRFDKVAHLISGFETPYGMELLATVHWVSEEDGAKTLNEAIEKVHAWNEHKKGFSESHIELAWNRLGSNGLIPS